MLTYKYVYTRFYGLNVMFGGPPILKTPTVEHVELTKKKMKVKERFLELSHTDSMT
jgi:hypothetical protein